MEEQRDNCKAYSRLPYSADVGASAVLDPVFDIKDNSARKDLKMLSPSSYFRMNSGPIGTLEGFGTPSNRPYFATPQHDDKGVLIDPLASHIPSYSQNAPPIVLSSIKILPNVETFILICNPTDRVVNITSWSVGGSFKMPIYRPCSIQKQSYIKLPIKRRKGDHIAGLCVIVVDGIKLSVSVS